MHFGIFLQELTSFPVYEINSSPPMKVVNTSFQKFQYLLASTFFRWMNFEREVETKKGKFLKQKKLSKKNSKKPWP